MARAALAAAYFVASALAHGWDILALSQWRATVGDRSSTAPPPSARGLSSGPSAPPRPSSPPPGARENGGDGSSDRSGDTDSWWVQVWIGMLLRIAENSIHYCGTLCASIGLAARWSYWLITGVVLVFILQVVVWTYTWVVHPTLTHSRVLWRYCQGRSTWNDVACLQGHKPFIPTWKGPHTRRPWTAQYVQKEVRGRGARQKPFDLLVTDGVAVARLRHSTVRFEAARTATGSFASVTKSGPPPTGTSATFWKPGTARFTCARTTHTQGPRRGTCTSRLVPSSHRSRRLICRS